jgi:uncharacterized protein with ATP-grasp and redox domains
MGLAQPDELQKMNKPNLPLPEPLRGLEPNSFAHNTVVERLPNILRRVVMDNDFPRPIVRQLESLLAEIPSAQIRPLNDSDAPDESDWARYIEPYLELNWLQLPWFSAETYFYRRILAATGYFKSGPGHGVDPFAYEKQRGLQVHQDEIANLGPQLTSLNRQSRKLFEYFSVLLVTNLWGNQADLSLWPAGHADQPKHTDLAASQRHIVVNDTNTVVDYLAGQLDQSPRIDFIVDNAGFELVSDLVLADFFLGNIPRSTVVLHVKFHPTFVSDAISQDVEQTIEFLAGSLQSDIRSLGQRLQAQLDEHRLRLQNDLFWTSPLSFWDMPERVRQELAQAKLLISKGDANYRRLLGDRHWSYTTPFADIVSYLPTPLVALRTFKSEVAAGLQPEQIKVLAEQDPNWLTNGKRGVIQFVD